MAGIPKGIDNACNGGGSHIEDWTRIDRVGNGCAGSRSHMTYHFSTIGDSAGLESVLCTDTIKEKRRNEANSLFRYLSRCGQHLQSPWLDVEPRRTSAQRTSCWRRLR